MHSATLLVLLCLPQPAPQSAPQSRPASRGDELRQQLASREPFAIAWAAAQAREQSARWLCDALPPALTILQGLPATEERLIATATVLDAMIELGCPVDSAALRRTAHFGQALRTHVLILASQNPARCVEFLRELRPELLSDIAWQVATNALLTADPAGAARLLAREANLRLRITVHDPGRDPERGERRPRESRTQRAHGVPIPRGWPAIGRYQLVRGRPGPDEVSLGDAPQLVGFSRQTVRPETEPVVEFSPEDSYLQPVDRDQYRLLCLWRLAGNEDQPTFRATTRFEEEWSDLPAHTALVERETGELRAAWRQLVDRLVQRGLLRIDPRDDLRAPVFVELADQRRRKDPPLTAPGR